jgi:hypothetical protein
MPQLPHRNAFMTLFGLPVSIELEWPFHPSTSGADYNVLHGTVRLEDGGVLHAQVSVHLTEVVHEQLGSLEREKTESLVINSLRKEIDRKQLELLKSGKRQPVDVSSRYFDTKRQRFANTPATDEQIYDFLRRKLFWIGHKLGGGEVALADGFDAEYLVAAPEKVMAVAKKLEAEKLARISGDRGTATERLIAAAPQLQMEMKQALYEFESKHAFERA